VSDRALSAVVIGGSAGAIDGLSRLLPALATDCGVPVAVVVHLPRDRPSQLAQIFGAKCQLPVEEAEDKLPISPGTVYFAPPDYHILIDEGPSFALAADELVHYSRPAIDILFESAADAYGARLFGLLLSGANADGAHGLACIARAGGLTAVQRPSSAVAAAMPLAALAAVPNAASLEIAEMATWLSAIRKGRCPNAPPRFS